MSTSLTIPNPGGSVELVSDGTDYHIISSFIETGHIIFGLDGDSITQGPSANGTNAVGKYGNIHETGIPFKASFSCVGIPLVADTVVDVLCSTDGGLTWASIFPTGLANKLHFPQSSAVHRINYTVFNNVIVHKDTDLVRLDVLQFGGAVGLTITIKFGMPGASS